MQPSFTQKTAEVLDLKNKVQNPWPLREKKSKSFPPRRQYLQQDLS